MNLYIHFFFFPFQNEAIAVHLKIDGLYYRLSEFNPMRAQIISVWYHVKWMFILYLFMQQMMLDPITDDDSYIAIKCNMFDEIDRQEVYIMSFLL